MFVTVASAAYGGFFLNERVWVDQEMYSIPGTSTLTHVKIKTQAIAKYFGQPDGDRLAFIETTSFSTQNGWVATVWDHWISKPGPFVTGQTFACLKTLRNGDGYLCGANQNVSVRLCPNAHAIQGRAQAYNITGFGGKEFAGWMYASPEYVPCNSPPGGGGGCGSMAGKMPTETVVVPLVLGPGRFPGVSPAVASGSFAAFGLTRVETDGDESFIGEEWAIVDAAGSVRAASDERFAREKLLQLQTVAGVAGRYLIVERPVHIMNERYVPLPRVGMSAQVDVPIRPPYTTPRLAILRVEFEHGNVTDAEVIDGVLTRSQIHGVAALLLVEYESETMHRARVYAYVRLVGQRIELLNSIVVLPQCCCGSEFCL